MVVKIQAKVFWVVMLCSVVVLYQCFRGPWHPFVEMEAAWTSECWHTSTTLRGITTQRTSTWVYYDL